MRTAAVFLYGTILAVRAAAGPADPRVVATLEEALPPPDRPALLVFFSPACPSCYEELFEWRRRLEAERLPVALVGVCAGPRDELVEFCRTYRLDGPVVHDARRRVHRRFGVDAPPAKVVLWRGRVLYADDPRRDPAARKEELTSCLRRFRSG